MNRHDPTHRFKTILVGLIIRLDKLCPRSSVVIWNFSNLQRLVWRLLLACSFQISEGSNIFEFKNLEYAWARFCLRLNFLDLRSSWHVSYFSKIKGWRSKLAKDWVLLLASINWKVKSFSSETEIGISKIHEIHLYFVTKYKYRSTLALALYRIFCNNFRGS